MAIRDLVPWNWGKQKLPVRRDEEYPLHSLQREMNRLFDDFFGGSMLEPFRGWEDRLGDFSPSVNVTETGKEVKVTAELPGMDEKDIDVSLANETLTIKGEKRQEEESKEKGVYRRERSYGSFQRVVPLPSEVDGEKVEATFKKGVLTVTLPKSEAATASRRRVTVKGA
jgi:HSP20 family protein